MHLILLIRFRSKRFRRFFFKLIHFRKGFPVEERRRAGENGGNPSILKELPLNLRVPYPREEIIILLCGHVVYTFFYL